MVPTEPLIGKSTKKKKEWLKNNVAKPSPRYIVRIETKKFTGYYLRMKIDGVMLSKAFSDSKFGGIAKSKKAADDYLAELLKQNPDKKYYTPRKGPKKQEFKPTLGLVRQAKHRNDLYFYVIVKLEPLGKLKRKYFNITKLGRARALTLANLYRKQMEELIKTIPPVPMPSEAERLKAIEKAKKEKKKIAEAKAAELKDKREKLEKLRAEKEKVATRKVSQAEKKLKTEVEKIKPAGKKPKVKAEEPKPETKKKEIVKAKSSQAKSAKVKLKTKKK
ncbi:MAG: hypothetical protein J0L62_17610 [Bacteroidetes bacterium]|nr:hypothetical protein [Bacteroidota bacterium]